MWRYTSQPSSEPVTLTEAKDHLKIDGTTDDDYITELIKHARNFAEDYMSRTIMTRDVEYRINKFPGVRHIELPVGPCNTSTGFAITYTDDEGNTGQTFATSNYELVNTYKPNIIRLLWEKEWPSDVAATEPITITYKSGVDSATDVPYTIKQAIMLLVADMYEHRTTTPGRSNSRRSCSSERLLNLHREWRFQDA